MVVARRARPSSTTATPLLAAALACSAPPLLLRVPFPTVVLAVAAGVALVGAVSADVLRRRPLVLGPADRVTLARLVLVGTCATVAVLAFAGLLAHRSWLVLALAVPALLLDLVDGPVARRTGTASPGGAAFDNDTDSALVGVLSVLAAPVVGWWVLLIGAMRYLFVAVSWVRPQLRGQCGPSRFRRLVGASQGVALMVALAPVVPLSAVRVLLALALVLLVVSFGRDAVVLERRPVPERGRVMTGARR